MALWMALAAALAADGVTVQPADTGEALRNPGMGWVLHFYDNVPTNYGSRLAPSDTVDDFPGMNCVYLRIPWSYVEPEEGKFCWSVLDAPTQRWRDKGLQIALRISVCESWTRWATPEWVQKAGAKGYNFTPGKVDEKGPYWEPDYNDPVFLDKLDRFLAALAKRYDGDPAVSFVDVGSFGVWGEGHLWASTQMKYPAETVIRHIDLYRKHFGKSLLVANDDFSFQGDAAIDYAREHGLGLRDDSILVQPGKNAYFHAEMAQGFWPTVPTILESEHYGGSRDRGNWGDGSLYLKALEEYHASYASIHWWPREFLAECGPLIAAMNKRMGYRLLPTSITWPQQIELGGELSVDWSWRNAGVAPCYAGGYPCLTLTDAKGGVVGVFVDDALNARDLPVGPADQVLTKRSKRSYPLAYNQTSTTARATPCPSCIAMPPTARSPSRAIPWATRVWPSPATWR
ncbi:MAG: beta-galactosidase [Armatimonadetes bacterium]|nr:beta-galactosidase [Armatimonadota bacterium]